MALPDITLKHVYNSEKDNILEDFYINVLRESVSYKRITGYFSSSSFSVAGKGLIAFIKNGGNMQFILNVQLIPNDYKAIQEGLKSPENIISRILLDDLENNPDQMAKNHAAILGWLVANQILDVKIGYLESEQYGKEILHQKVGIVEDNAGNTLTFSGSNNESAMGWKYNSEKFKVFFSWEDNSELYECDINDFDELWNDRSPRTRVIPFPEAVKKEIIRLAPSSFEELEKLIEKTYPPDDDPKIRLRSYQLEAIDSWLSHDRRGIFEMATGTGKTITAISALKNVLEREKKLLTIISCPYLHLCRQWEDTLEEMEVHLPLYHASSINTKWNDQVMGAILNQKLGKENQFIVMTTHDTISSEKFISTMKEANVPILLIGDEIHGMGSSKRLAGLQDIYQYRLGLSATPERYLDEEGTEELMTYFGGIVYSFDLSRAITEINPETGKSYLAPYQYHPIFVELSTEDMDEYLLLSGKIAVLMNRKKRTTSEIAKLEKFLLKRQDIVNNSSTKYPAFRDLLTNLLKEGDISHTLVYCAPKQIETAQDIIREQGTIIQHKFTNTENARKKERQYHGMTEREYLLSNFDKGVYNVLVAIRCLDEGVDVPSTRNAILLSSSGNPKEYIQRRGRVLRRAPDKEMAVIYDISVLPNMFSGNYTEDAARGLVEKELKRVRIFATDAINCAEVCGEVHKIEEKYGLI
ncbi:DEAD/DEAH box helicase family protein [Methanovulcanius yangii]|uniref:DEAD/DEAH box helicase family protein n=1 Tax=Methanovulcanius yangii TaxID=1789227 RepID=UPI0029CA69A5|nr:DEAD/DEAH box helicase family protein [Methanovulcanius yangii]